MTSFHLVKTSHVIIYINTHSHQMRLELDSILIPYDMIYVKNSNK